MDIFYNMNIIKCNYMYHIFFIYLYISYIIYRYRGYRLFLVQAPQLFTSCTTLVFLLQLMNLHLYIITQIPQFMLDYTLGVVYLMGFDECIIK